jgi:hypothetical protein
MQLKIPFDYWADQVPSDWAPCHRVVTALVRLRQEGKLQCVWCDEGVLHIRYSQWEPRIPITWAEAEALCFRKPPQSVIITEVKEKSA